MTIRAIDSRRAHEVPAYLAEMAQEFSDKNLMRVWIVVQFEEWFFSPFAPGSREGSMCKLHYIAEVNPDSAAAGQLAALVGG